jgi:hypothetical protein
MRFVLADSLRRNLADLVLGGGSVATSAAPVVSADLTVGSGHAAW